jgi:HxlR-like helix-turn-helix
VAGGVLADRLRDLERAGVVVREDTPPPTPATLFRLTERGEQVRTGDRPMIIETTGDGTVRARPGTTAHPDAVLTGHPRPLLGLLAGRLDLQQAAAQGAHYEGDPGTLTRVLPQPVAA